MDLRDEALPFVGVGKYLWKEDDYS